MSDRLTTASLLHDRASRRIPRERATGPLTGGCPACGAPSGSTDTVLGRAALPRRIAAALSLAPSLTAREAAAFKLLGLGYDNRSIARTLSISERTAKRYVTAILTKLRLESRLQAGLAAMAMHLAVPAGQAPQAARSPRAAADAVADLPIRNG